MNAVNYLLLFKGNSDKGGYESSVRGFIKLEAARSAMAESYRELAAVLNIPVSAHSFGNPYTAKTETSIRLERGSDSFQWEIIQAVPEDGGLDDTAKHNQKYGLKNYTITIEEHIAQEFAMKAHDIFDAMRSAEKEYKQGTLVVQPSKPNTSLIMARDDETGDVTEWKAI